MITIHPSIYPTDNITIHPIFEGNIYIYTVKLKAFFHIMLCVGKINISPTYRSFKAFRFTIPLLCVSTLSSSCTFHAQERFSHTFQKCTNFPIFHFPFVFWLLTCMHKQKCVFGLVFYLSVTFSLYWMKALSFSYLNSSILRLIDWNDTTNVRACLCFLNILH